VTVEYLPATSVLAGLSLDSHDTPDRATEADSAATIRRQAAEIERLQRELAGLRPLIDLRDALHLAGVAGIVGAPASPTRLTRMLVVTAADVINAQAGSLFLLDHERDELVFEVAIGPKAAAAEKFRIPLGHGIAGLVAATGQPMAIADTEADTRDAEDIAAAVGYSPRNVLCVPLMYEDDLIGVLELLDKEGGQPFSAIDMEVLALFAELAAVAVKQDHVLEQLRLLVAEAVGAIDGLSEHERALIDRRAAALVDDIVGDAGFTQALGLARLVREIAHRGDRELRACRSLLEGFAEYLRAQPTLTHERDLWQ
jgi:GAF domain-containing protein